MSGADLAAAAEALIGAPFRLYGRDPETGIDCVGLLLEAIARCGRPLASVPDYSVRRQLPALPPGCASAAGLVRVAEGSREPGDVLLFRVSPVQGHLAIAASRRAIIHAHAGLRRVVCGPPSPEWDCLEHWRLLPAP